MGGVSVESGGKGGKKSVEANINMVPMIDLLVSCIAFLLMTAVWVQTGAVQAAQPRGAPSPDQPQDQQQDQLKIRLTGGDNGRASLSVGVSLANMQDIGSGPTRFDELRTKLNDIKRANQQNREVWIQPDSVVPYNEIIRAMDVVYEIYGSARQNEVTIRFL